MFNYSKSSLADQNSWMPSRLCHSQEKQRAKKKHPPNVIYVVNIIIILLPPAMLIINSSLLSVADSLQKNVLLYGTIEPVWFNMGVVFSFRISSLYKTPTISVTMLKKKTHKEFFFRFIQESCLLGKKNRSTFRYRNP